MKSGIFNKFRSPLEKKVSNTLDDWRLPHECNYEVDFFEIDIAFPEDLIAVEIDGAKYHGSEQRSKDLQRQHYLEDKGWKFERFDGWFANRYPNVISAKLLLRYFKDRHDDLTIRRAKSVLGQYFVKIANMPELGNRLISEAV